VQLENIFSNEIEKELESCLVSEMKITCWKILKREGNRREESDA
jgi:hypothetical protein